MLLFSSGLWAQTVPQVLFSTDGTNGPVAVAKVVDRAPATPVSDAERGGVTITATTLDLHLIPASAGVEGQATLVVRNSSTAAVGRVPLQLSSTLRWQTVAVGGRAVAFTQSPIATDADHTGYAQEAVMTLAEPLAPGASLTVTAFYSGEIRQAAGRLELQGAPPERAALVDWDQITPEVTALRGFGDVIWYPVAAPTAILGDANRLFRVIGEQRLENSASTVHLRLTVEYVGDPPTTAIFDGRSEPLARNDDTQDQTVAQTQGLATFDFGSRPIGFRSLNLFVTQLQPTVAGGELLAVISPVSETIEPLNAAAALVQPMVQDWLGAGPKTPLTVLDHAGQPFEDGALLVTPLDANATAEALAPQMIHGLAHAWLHSGHPWIDEGVAQFMDLLWLEHTAGRPAAVEELQHMSTLIALAEPDLTAKPTTESSSQVVGSTEVGQPLVRASADVYFRTKAASVFFQLRSIVGDDQLKAALQAYRKSEVLDAKFDADPSAFQHTLERVSKRDLAWFFDDWVNRDRGLPDLTIVSVTPRPLPARAGKNNGYLIAVEVRNEGTAIAEVPVTARSGEITATERLRIPAGAAASTRIVFEGTPDVIQVNDGTVPELRANIHTREVNVTIEKH